MFKRSDRRGFTLIELLVVIAIIGILSSVVLASLNSARKKGRDARRLADIKQLQLALELFYDANGAYPATTSVALLVTPGYIAAIPQDPTNLQTYAYVPYGTTGTPATCVGYHLGATLETSGHSSFASDSDIIAMPSGYQLCTATGSTGASATGITGSEMNGSDSAKCQDADVGVGCYDVKS
ncbi:prepilin-type N-terminal cleavage/methylation domain-containing protein [Candidatus Kaiserbacteria bacterium]|nr:prepilin-type N-terminal cleavage/methylation domain-containing protein [Candidatus Kaiserbacteria bacterium]